MKKLKSGGAGKILKTVGLLCLAILLVFGIYSFFKPIPQVNPKIYDLPQVESKPVSVALPSYGQSTISEKSVGVLAVSGTQTAQPIASTAKMITALAVLQKKPLKPGEQGPIVTLTQADVDDYNSYYAQGGSVTKVVVGEQITQYQMLQAMLLPSSNNMANSLARWAFGSVDEYVKYANTMVATMSLSQTKVADASGFSKDSVSTAQELTVLGQKLMEEPVLAEIVAQPSAVIPVAGEIKNVNWLLGSEGVNGIKTGNTDEAGGCFVFSAKRTIQGQEMNFVGAIIGAPERNQAIADASHLLSTIDQNFDSVVVVKKNQEVGIYQTPWETSAPIVAGTEVKVVRWKGLAIDSKASAEQINGEVPAGQVVGQVKATYGKQSETAKLVTGQKLYGPSWQWRIFR